jgi:MFS family permease
MPEYAHDFGTDDSGLRYSVLLAANAAGALSGALLLESTGLLPPKVRTALITSALWSVAIGLFPLAPSYEVGLALLVAAGMLNITFLSMAQTLVQILAPVSLRGRVIGLYSTAQFGLRMGSGMTVGVLGSFIGVHWSLALSAAAFLLVALGLLIYDGVATGR